MKSVNYAIKFRSAHALQYFFLHHFYSIVHYNQSHTTLLSLCMQRPIRGVQLVIAETPDFFLLLMVHLIRAEYINSLSKNERFCTLMLFIKVNCT